MSFDQYMAIYTLYFVLATRVTLSLYNQTGIPTIVGVCFAPSTSGPASAEGFVESGQCTFKVLPAALSLPVSLSASCSIPAFVGKHDIIDDQQFAGTISSNPAVPIYANVFVQDTNATSTVTVQALVTMDFDVVFTMPRALVQS
jgi:hypothetical protein